MPNQPPLIKGVDFHSWHTALAGTTLLATILKVTCNSHHNKFQGLDTTLECYGSWLKFAEDGTE